MDATTKIAYRGGIQVYKSEHCDGSGTEVRKYREDVWNGYCPECHQLIPCLPRTKQSMDHTRNGDLTELGDEQISKVGR